jgi:tetratricopeptide (TPR) repeat protein
MLAGDFEAAERELRASVEKLEAMNDKGFLSTIVVALGEALAAQGRYDRADRYAEYARSLAAPDDLASQGGWRALSAKVLAHRGAFPEAERLARESVAIGEPTDFLPFKADWLMTLADVLAAAEKRAAAADVITKALDLCEKKGNLVMASRCRTELIEAGS